jgi:hypothetical protein
VSPRLDRRGRVEAERDRSLGGARGVRLDGVARDGGQQARRHREAELAGIGARQREEGVHEPGEALDLAERDGERLAVLVARAGAPQGHLDRAPHVRQGGAQLVGRVGEEAPLGVKGRLEAGQHLVEDADDLAQLHVARHLGDARAQVRLPHRAGALGDALERAREAARQPVRAPGRGHAAQHETRGQPAEERRQRARERPPGDRHDGEEGLPRDVVERVVHAPVDPSAPAGIAEGHLAGEGPGLERRIRLEARAAREALRVDVDAAVRAPDPDHLLVAPAPAPPRGMGTPSWMWMAPSGSSMADATSICAIVSSAPSNVPTSAFRAQT